AFSLGHVVQNSLLARGEGCATAARISARTASGITARIVACNANVNAIAAAYTKADIGIYAARATDTGCNSGVYTLATTDGSVHVCVDTIGSAYGRVNVCVYAFTADIGIGVCRYAV